jgi:hypothetical protein
MTRLDVTNLEIECHTDGSTKVKVWCNCFQPDDIDDLVAWLGLAKTVMERWGEIREKRSAARGAEARPATQRGAESGPPPDRAAKAAATGKAAQRA